MTHRQSLALHEFEYNILSDTYWNYINSYKSGFEFKIKDINIKKQLIEKLKNEYNEYYYLRFKNNVEPKKENITWENIEPPLPRVINRLNMDYKKLKDVELLDQENINIDIKPYIRSISADNLFK